MKKIYLLLLAFILVFTNGELKAQTSKVKYVFFFIGDGMGEAHVNLTEAYLAQMKDSIGIHHLTMTDFPVMGLSTTFAATRFITGSAAAGTALATGHKTSINTIGLSADRKDTLYSIAYYAHKKGMKVGILTSVSINHATPAVFYAHQPLRSQYYQISKQMPLSGFEVFGGGNIYQAKDSSYLLLKQAGYKIVHTYGGFDSLKNGDGKVYMYAPHTLSEAEMPYVIDRKPGELTLADFTSKAIELLDNPKGFFMMVEGGKIDWAAHANDAATVIEEVIDFDNAIAEAVKFYKQHPDETIIIITADHETGGLALGSDLLHYDSNLKLLSKQKHFISYFSDSLENFIVNNGVENFTFDKMNEIAEYFFGVKYENLNEEQAESLKNAYNSFIKNRKEEQMPYSELNKLSVAWLKIFDNMAGVGWTTHSHTGIAVPVRVMGQGQELFDGFYDNTDIPKKIGQLIGVDLK